MNQESKTHILRWGLLSTARINRSLIHVIRLSRHSELIAVASRSLMKASAYAQEWDIPKAHGSYEALLADPDIDVIYNSLPNSLHTEWTIKALEAGKHVLCEKPICLTVGELDQISAAVQRSGKVVTEAFMYRHHPQTLKVSKLIHSGAIGDLQLIRGSFSFKLNRSDDPRLDQSMGGGSIWDIGCYPISYAIMLTSTEPEEVFGWQVSGPSGVDLVFAGQMRFPNNVYAQFESSFSVPYRVNIEIIGSEGVIYVPNPYKPGKREKIILNQDGKSKIIPIRGQELYIGEVLDIENAILHNLPPRISLADSRTTVATIRAFLLSAQLNQPICF